LRPFFINGDLAKNKQPEGHEFIDGLPQKVFEKAINLRA
jgi:hypothetical protein